MTRTSRRGLGMAIVLMALATTVRAQSPQVLWTKYLFGPRSVIVRGVVEALDEGYVITGQAYPPGDYSPDMLVAKMSVTGDVLWQKLYGVQGRRDRAYAINTTRDGGYVVCGNDIDADFLLMRLSPNGDSLWAKSYGGGGTDVARAVTQTFDGGFALCGYSASVPRPPHMNVYFVLTDSMGDSLLARACGDVDEEEGYAMARTPDSCYLIAGYTDSYSPVWKKPYLVKVDSTGWELWDRFFTFESHAWFSDIVALADTGYMAVGYATDSTYSDTGLFVMRLDPDAESVWVRQYGREYGDYAYGLAWMVDGDFVVCGKVGETTRVHDAWLLGVDRHGDTTWSMCFGDAAEEDMLLDVLAASDGSLVTVGAVDYVFYPETSAAIVVKTEPTGNLIRNGDFTFWRNEADAFGWSADDTTKARVGRCADTAYSPPYSARLTRLVSGSGHDCGVRRLIVVKGGEHYTLTAWVLDQSDEAVCGIGISWYDADTGFISSSATVYTDSGIARWQALSVSDQAPQNARFADVQVRVYGHAGSQPGGVVYADNIALTKGLTGVTEPWADLRKQGPPTATTFVRAALVLPGTAAASLHDIMGRRVMSLQPGPNDIRSVSPGVYFVTPSPQPSPPWGERMKERVVRTAVHKIVVQR
ncbi:MAG: hypothetical protein JSU73_08050 [candidate division WOR-3 bacterium]|nr:MAG: hypothetical protein JSU73_08050 [candidate division WOR-3 bacterium]